MTLIRTRRCLAGVLGLLLATAGHAQTIETFAGGGTIQDAPGTSVSAPTMSVAVGPDGRVYVIEVVSGRLLRFDPATSTTSSMRGNDGEQELIFQSQGVFAFDATGRPHVTGWNGLELIDFDSGHTTNIASGIGNIAQMQFDAQGNLFFADANGSRIRMRYPWGQIIDFAGNGGAGFAGDGGPAWQAQFDHPNGVAVDAVGNVYVADTWNHRIRKISFPDRIVTTIAGTGNFSYTGDGIPAVDAGISLPFSLAIDAAGNLYFGERGSARVRRIAADTGIITTVAGGDDYGFSGDGGAATAATFYNTEGIALDASGNLYIADTGNSRVRRVSLATGIVDTVLGNGSMNFCGDGAPALEACLYGPDGLAFDHAGNLYISDGYNGRIRRVSASTGIMETIAGRDAQSPASGDDGPAIDASFGEVPRDLAINPNGELFVATGFDHRVRRINLATGIIDAWAGTGVAGFSGDGGLAPFAKLNVPSGVVADVAGNLYISDTNNHRIRKVQSGTRVITTVAGTGLTTGPLGDGGPATSASLHEPEALALDGAGNLLIADRLHYRIRKLDVNTGIITTIAGTGSPGHSGDGGPALLAGLDAPEGVTFDGLHSIYVTGYGSIRKIDTDTGIIRAVVGPGTNVHDQHGQSLVYPSSMAFDDSGRLYVSDSQFNSVRRVSDLDVAPPDTTPPVITANVSGTAGSAGWYRGDVQVSWSIVEAESDSYGTTGCAAASVTTDTAGITFHCNATSSGGSSSRSVTIKRDATAPTLTFGAATPAPDASGWNSTDVSIPFTAADALSGVGSTSTASPLVVSGQGAGITRTVTVTDVAGNSATFTSPAVNIDRAAPSVTPNVTGSLGNAGWYRGDVQLTWTITHGDSPVSSSSGCDASTVATDTAGITFTCSVTSASGTASDSVTIKRDATAPTLSFGASSPAANDAGWNTTDVSVPFTTNDAMSGVASTSATSPLVVSEQGSGVTRSVTVVDVAGNSMTLASPAFNIDKSVPAVTPLITGTSGNNGWYTSNVEVSWTISDEQSPVSVVSGCSASSVTTDTAGVTFACSVASGGGSASSSVTVKRDATPPVITFGTPSPAPNANGWNKPNVLIPFTVTETMSDLDVWSHNSPLVLGTEGAGVTEQVTYTDLAGNTTTVTSPPRNIDKTAPVVTIASPANGATFGFYQDVVANYSCADVSPTTCTGPVANGQLVNTRSAGAKTFKVTGKDAVAFTTAITNSFTVESTFNWGGFSAPANPPTINRVARNTRVPLRWQLPDGHGGFVTNTAAYKSIASSNWSCASNPSTPYTETTTAPAGISFDAATSSFVYNWNTGSTAVCRTVIIELRDGSLHELYFNIQ